MKIPDEAVQAAHAEYHKVLGDSNRSNPMRAALTAAMPFLTGVKVKKLEWVKPPLSETLSRCETEFGTYRTWTHDEANGKWFWSVEGGYNEVTGEATDEAAAKAAAQTDYEARILSAIEPAPSPRAQALEEAIATVRAKGERIKKEANAFQDVGTSLEATIRIKVCDEIRTLSSQPVADGWLPIETAPKDGSEFLAWPCNTENGDIVVKAHWYMHPSVEAWITKEIDCGEYDFTPTHWRPLPASPGASE